MITKEDIALIDTMRQDLEDGKRDFVETWKKIAGFLGLAYGDWDRNPNNSKNPEYKRIDQTAAYASRTLADGVEGYAFSRSMEWMELECKDLEDERDNQIAKAFLERLSAKVYEELAKSNFYEEARSMVRSGADMGTGAINFSYDMDKARFRFSTLHLNDFLPIANEYKEVDGVIRYVYLTKRQAEKFFPGAELPKRVAECTKPLDKFEFINIVSPAVNWDFDIPGRGDYVSIWYSEDDKEHTLREDRVSDLPFAVWRYSSPIYGGTWGVDSPGQISLPAMHFLNLLMEDYITLGEMVAKGHWKKTKGLKVNFKAGGVTDLESGQDFGWVQATGDLSWLQQTIDHYRDVINENYQTSLFLVLTQNLGRTKTATEVEGIEAEKSNLMASFFARLSGEFLKPTVLWVAKEILRLGLMEDITEDELRVLKDIDYDISFVSPMFRAQEKAFELTSTTQWLQDVINLSQIHPDIIDKVDWDKFVDIDHKIRHAKSDVLIPTDDANRVRQARAQAQAQAMAQQQQSQQLGQLASAYDALGKAPQEGSAMAKLQNGGR